MTLEKECSELQKWFDETYPMHWMKIHQGRGAKNCEEYTIELKFNGKHKGVKFRIPDHAEFQDPEYIKKLREAFVTQQKRAIQEAFRGSTQ